MYKRVIVVPLAKSQIGRIQGTANQTLACKEDQVPIPFEECYSRQDIRDRRPRLLLTNYSQLEYLLLRDRDLDMFRMMILVVGS